MGLLDGKVAIVTGAGNGVGRGEAIELADQGAKVVVNDLGVSVTGEGADKRTADEVVDVIKSRGGEAVANYDDVADFNGAKSIIDTAVEAFGKLDALVNNAGILRDKMLFTMGEDEFDSVIRVHLKGTWSTCTTLRPTGAPSPRRVASRAVRSSTRSRAPVSRARRASRTTARPRPGSRR